jgi:hypothetical protein
MEYQSNFIDLKIFNSKSEIFCIEAKFLKSVRQPNSFEYPKFRCVIVRDEYKLSTQDMILNQNIFEELFNIKYIEHYFEPTSKKTYSFNEVFNFFGIVKVEENKHHKKIVGVNKHIEFVDMLYAGVKRADDLEIREIFPNRKLFYETSNEHMITFYAKERYILDLFKKWLFELVNFHNVDNKSTPFHFIVNSSEAIIVIENHLDIFNKIGKSLNISKDYVNRYFLDI